MSRLVAAHHGEYTSFGVAGSACRTQKLLYGRYEAWRGRVDRPEGRESWRTPPLWMTINRMRGLCWCGRTKSGPDRKFCLDRNHYDMWACCIRTTWGPYAQYRARAGVPCDACGRLQKPWSEREAYESHQVDHVTPLADGGEMWANHNHQILCTDCHKAKTAAESRARAKLRADILTVEHKKTILGGGPDLTGYFPGPHLPTQKK